MKTCLYLVGCFLLLIIPSAQGQDLETIGNGEAVKLSGGLSLNQIAYRVHGIESRRDPYSYFLYGNLNLALYGWNVPFSFAVSNQNRSFQQPFNQFGLHPTYKWATAHIGYSSMSFSPYTLSGHIFRGVGVELNPGRFTFSAMRGQLKRAVELDTISNTIAAFERTGYGFKSGYRNGGDYAEFSLFHGEDDPNSIINIPTDNTLLPEENLVMGISLGKMILERISIQTEYGSSALTRNTLAESGNNRFPFSGLGGFSSTISTSYYNAFKASANYQAERYTVGLGYERIDPGYQTHGAYYFNNDLENITVNGSSSMLDSRLNLSASAGLQHDNLDNSKISTMSRAVGSLNATYSPSNKLSLNASYSNFQSFTNIRSQFININQLTPYDNLDTLQFTQISQSLNLSSNYNFGTGQTKRQMIFMSLSVQDAAEKQSQVAENSGSRFYNMNTSYSLSLVPSNFTLSISYNLNQNNAPLVNLVTHGPSVSVSKALLERKLRLTFTSAHNSTISNRSVSNVILNFRGGVAYAASKSHNFNLGLVAVNRSSKLETGPASFTEYTGTLTYSYSFQ